MIQPSHQAASVVLNHADLKIVVKTDRNGNRIFVGTSDRYEPYTASAPSLIECFFCFNIQLAEQKKIAALIR